MLECLYVLNESFCMALTLLFVLSFVFHESSQKVHLFIDGFDCRIGIEELVSSGHLLGSEFFGSLPQCGKGATFVPDLWCNRPHHLNTVLVD